MFLLVWYYCTLTIRESILKVNGSRIKGWWRLHHFISTFTAGVLLIWPNTGPWYIFRRQFMWFNCYISEYLFFQGRGRFRPDSRGEGCEGTELESDREHPATRTAYDSSSALRRISVRARQKVLDHPSRAFGQGFEALKRLSLFFTQLSFSIFNSATSKAFCTG